MEHEPVHRQLAELAEAPQNRLGQGQDLVPVQLQIQFLLGLWRLLRPGFLWFFLFFGFLFLLGLGRLRHPLLSRLLKPLGRG